MINGDVGEVKVMKEKNGRDPPFPLLNIHIG